MQMKRFLIKCLVFLGIVIGANILFLILLLQYVPGFNKVHEMSKFKDKDYDLIVLGNSMALDGIDASYISEQGIKSYNLSLGGIHISTTLELFENYLAHNNRPEMVVIGLSSAVGRSYLNPVAYHNPEVDFFYQPSLWKNITNPPLLNFQWLAIEMIKIIASKEHRNATMISGQWRTKKTIADNSSFDQNRAAPLYYDNVYFQRLLHICEEKNIKAIVVEMTGSKKTQNLVPFEKEFAISATKKIKVYNLNNRQIATELISPRTDWLSPDHLNIFGAAKETQFLFHKVIQPNYTK